MIIFRSVTFLNAPAKAFFHVQTVRRRSSCFATIETPWYTAELFFFQIQSTCELFDPSFSPLLPRQAIAFASTGCKCVSWQIFVASSASIRFATFYAALFVLEEFLRFYTYPAVRHTLIGRHRKTVEHTRIILRLYFARDNAIQCKANVTRRQLRTSHYQLRKV